MARPRQIELVLNPELIDSTAHDATEAVGSFQATATDFVQALSATTPEEQNKKNEWFSQIPNLGVRELINFQLYQEFSRASLTDSQPPQSGSLAEIDAYTDSQGWLEFRFGNGKFQSGYYDNDDVCEVRLAPCEPNEAIRRKKIILGRIVELSSAFGLLVQSSAEQGEHINLSVYEAAEDGEYRPVIGQDIERRARTLDIAAGVAAAFADGLWLHPKDVKAPYSDTLFVNAELEFGPTRRAVRIVEDRLELRAQFHQDDHAINWLLAGMLHGLQHGSEAISEEGYSIPSETTAYQPEFR